MQSISSLLKNKFVIIGGIAIIAIALPLIISQVLRQQDIRQRASTAPAISLRFDPSSSTAVVGQTFQVTLVMDTSGNDIGAVKYKVNFTSAVLEYVSAETISTLTPLFTRPSTGAVEIAAVNPNPTPINGSNIQLVKLTFRAKTTGNGEISTQGTLFESTAAGYNTLVPVNSSNISTLVSVSASSSQITVTMLQTPASTITKNSAQLSANVLKDINAQGYYQFRYGTTNSCSGTIIGGNQMQIGSTTYQPTLTVPNLTPNTTYYACLQYQIAGGTMQNSNIISFTTLSESATPTPTRTPSPTPTRTPTPTPSRTPSPTPTRVPSPTPTTGPTATTAPACPLKNRGDVNCDGKVDVITDFILWKGEFVTPGSLRADFDGNGAVNALDFVIWKGGYTDSSIPH